MVGWPASRKRKKIFYSEVEIIIDSSKNMSLLFETQASPVNFLPQIQRREFQDFRSHHFRFNKNLYNNFILSNSQTSNLEKMLNLMNETNKIHSSWMESHSNWSEKKKHNHCNIVCLEYRKKRRRNSIQNESIHMFERE